MERSCGPMNKNRIEGGAEQGERANQGAAGIDGLSIDETAERLRAEWPAIREQLPRGTYRPEPGRRVVVDVDLEKFFDRVNHNIPIDRLRKRVAGAGVIRLVRAYLTGGIMDGGVLMARSEGTPQGGPLSPLLANVLLDEVDNMRRLWRNSGTPLNLSRVKFPAACGGVLGVLG